jgi:hypothetical protein
MMIVVKTFLSFLTSKVILNLKIFFCLQMI